MSGQGRGTRAGLLRSPAPPTAEPAGPDSPPARGARGLGRGPARPGSPPGPRRASAPPRAPPLGAGHGRAASGHQPLGGGGLQAEGIFPRILLEAWAAARRKAAAGPRRAAPSPSPSPRPPRKLAPAERVHSPRGLDRTCPVALPSSAPARKPEPAACSSSPVICSAARGAPASSTASG